MTLTAEFTEAIKNTGTKLLFNEPMSSHTSFKIGGKVDILAFPENVSQIEDVVELCKKHNVPYYILGNGSNVLVCDDGLDGVVIKFENNMNSVSVSENTITAQAGALLSQIAAAALQNGLTGFETLCGIPGSIGGAVYMNAGAYGGEIKDVVQKTTYLSKDGKVCTVTGDEHQFGYRHSMFSDNGGIILECEIHLSKGDADRIKADMAEFNKRRRDKQPLEYPSCGSTFKRPEGHFAGALIERAGLKGYAIGGAQVSEKHAGFVINKGNATSEDVIRLIAHIKNTVYENSGIMLECEMKILK